MGRNLDIGLASAVLLAIIVAGAVFLAEDSDGDAGYGMTFEDDTGTISLTATASEGVYSCKLALQRGHDYPESVTITVGGRAFSDFSYTAWNGTVKIDAGKIDGKVTIKGKYTPKIYTVTLIPYVNDGSSSFKIQFGSDVLRNYRSPVKPDAVFAGYWTMSEGTGTMLVGPDGKLVPDVPGYVKAGTWDCDSNCTLYGKWNPLETSGLTIIYHANGGNFAGGTEIAYGYRALSFDASKTPKAEWGTFKGWAEKPDATVPKYTPSTTDLQISESMHLYAVWEHADPVSSDTEQPIAVDAIIPVVVLIAVAVLMIALLGRKTDRGGL